MSQTTHHDFDLMITRSSAASYTALVVASPAGQASHEFTRSSIEGPASQLLAGGLTENQIQAAGSALYESVFADAVEQAFVRSRDLAKAKGAGLRVRLRFGQTPELAGIPWEYLYRKSERKWLSLSTETPIVRYVDLADTIEPLQVDLPLRVLVVLPSVDDAARGLDVEAERRAIEGASRALVEAGFVEILPLQPATMTGLRAALTNTDIHIVHFIGHGTFDAASNEGMLVFDSEDGSLQRVTGSVLGSVLDEFDSVRLVILNACEGAMSSPSDSFAGAAQSLIANRIPAVVAMQTEITDAAAITFAKHFYAGITRGEPIDTAIVMARQALTGDATQSLVEWGTPALYMRADEGRLFDIPVGRSLGRSGLAEEDWRTLMKRLSWDKVTPILGWSLNQPALPSRQSIADALAGEYGYPIQDSADLPKVAQYVSVITDRLIPKDEVAALVGKASLNDLGPDAEAYRAVAELPISVFLTTNFDDLLYQALVAAGKAPTREVCPWRDPPADPRHLPPDVSADPTPDTPVVYHLHGHPSDPASMVLTEDDYFDYVVAVSRNQKIIRPLILERLSGTSLMLAGYHLEDWMFRVLVRGMVAAAEASGRGLSVAVQLPPSATETEYVEAYLAALFSASDQNRLRVYWGSATEFLTEIRDRWKAQP